MSTDFSKPLVTDPYATLLPGIKSAIVDLAKGLDPATTGTKTSTPADCIQWNSAASRWEKYNGTSWAAMCSLYAISISGNANTVTNGVYTTGTQTVGGLKTYTSLLKVVLNTSTPTYTNGHFTLESSDNSDVSFGFNRAGASGCQLRHSGDGLILSGTSRTAAATLTSTGNITAYSDERLKENWSSLPSDFVSLLAQVKSGTYSRKECGLRQVGVSAQSLQKIMPDAVLVGQDKEKTLSVAYGNAALAACVELAKEIVALRKQVQELKDSK